MPLPTPEDPDQFFPIDVDRLADKWRSAVGDADAKAVREWLDCLASSFESLEKALTDSSSLYRLNEFLPALTEHLAAFPLSEEKMARCFEIFQQSLPPGPMPLVLSALVLPNLLHHLREQRDAYFALEFCKDLVGRFGGVVRECWETAQAEYLSMESEGVPRIGTSTSTQGF